MAMTTQTRFWISTHPDFTSAKEAKNKAENDNPDGRYQIKRGWNKGKDVFRLVERFSLNETRVIQDTKRKNSKRGKKRQVWGATT
jgi:hypothetical protein